MVFLLLINNKSTFILNHWCSSFRLNIKIDHNIIIRFLYQFTADFRGFSSIPVWCSVPLSHIWKTFSYWSVLFIICMYTSFPSPLLCNYVIHRNNGNTSDVKLRPPLPYELMLNTYDLICQIQVKENIRVYFLYFVGLFQWAQPDFLSHTKNQTYLTNFYLSVIWRTARFLYCCVSDL